MIVREFEVKVRVRLGSDRSVEDGGEPNSGDAAECVTSALSDVYNNGWDPNRAFLYLDGFTVTSSAMMTTAENITGKVVADDECPNCMNGTVEVVDGEVRCRGECGATWKQGG